jgi:DNA replication and repair protein RecF
MRLKELELASFRLFKEKKAAFSPGINLVAGPNATGKTSFLEAIYLLWAGRSFKTGSWKDLILDGAPFFRVDLTLEKQGLEQKLGLGVAEKEKHFLYNKTAHVSFAPLLGVLKGVLLEPNDAALVHGPPNLRRRYLDLQLAQTTPLYVHHLLRYNRSLKERNALLKGKKKEGIEAYEWIMAQSGVYLRKARFNALKGLEPKLAHYYSAIAGKEESVLLEYQPSGGLEMEPERFLRVLSNSRARDYALGSTQAGLHRDEVKIVLNSKEAKHFASEGEKRSLASSLRLAEWELMQELSGEYPLFLVDDLGLGLDANRLASFLKLVHQMPQTLLTLPMEGPALEAIRILKLDVNILPWV